MGEREWVERITPEFEANLRSACELSDQVHVKSQHRLPYSHPIARYEGKNAISSRPVGYATDLLIYDEYEDASWMRYTQKLWLRP